MSHDFPDGPDYTQEEIARFWTHVAKGADDECWLWTGYCNPRGYGYFGIQRERSVPALTHRFAYATERGAIPAGMHIDHLCFNPTCVNPSHLECVTPEENRERQTQKFRAEARCKRGHLLTEETTYQYPNRRGRQCIECRRIRVEARRALR